MPDILSQNEIDDLLSAVSTGDSGRAGSSGVQKRFEVYDFRRPARFSGEELRTLQAVFDVFARLTATMLSAQTRSAAEMHVASVGHVTFEEYILSVSSPAVLGIVNINPQVGPVLIDIATPIAFAIIESLSGGHPGPSDFFRGLTAIERVLMERIYAGMVSNLRYSWSSAIDLDPVFSRLETDPVLAQIVPPGDMALLITCELKVGPETGMVNIVMPYITLEPLAERLTLKNIPGPAGNGSDSVTPGGHGRPFYKRYVLYSGALDNMTPEEIRKLRPGARLALKADAEGETVYEFGGAGPEGRYD